MGIVLSATKAVRPCGEVASREGHITGQLIEGEPMTQHWQQPGPPSRGLRLLVFAAVVVVILVIGFATIALLYTALLTPTPT
jgi:hypothetical protein